MLNERYAHRSISLMVVTCCLPGTTSRPCTKIVRVLTQSRSQTLTGG